MDNTFAPADTAAKTPTILVVDDTPENLLLISDLLRKSYKVKVANNAARALSIAQAAPQPGLILLDIMMPGMDGYEACERLKSDPLTRSIPVVFLTARTDEDHRGLDLGAAGYLTKPVKSSLLMEPIKTHLVVK